MWRVRTSDLREISRSQVQFYGTTIGRGKARVFRVGVTGKAAPTEARRAESGGGVFGEGAASSAGVKGGAPAAQRFFYILSALDGFSWPSGNAGVPLLKEEILVRFVQIPRVVFETCGGLNPPPNPPVASRLTIGRLSHLNPKHRRLSDVGAYNVAAKKLDW